MSEIKKAEVITNGNANLLNKVSTKLELWAVFDGGGQGMKNNGLLGVFTSEKAAKDFVGTNWWNIVPLTSDTPYPDGVEYSKNH